MARDSPVRTVGFAMNDFDLGLLQPVRVVARLCSISESGLRKMISGGVVPCLCVGMRGGGIRVIPNEVIASLRKRKTRR